jgi:hypothetical protein
VLLLNPEPMHAKHTPYHWASLSDSNMCILTWYKMTHKNTDFSFFLSLAELEFELRPCACWAGALPLTWGTSLAQIRVSCFCPGWA